MAKNSRRDLKQSIKAMTLDLVPWPSGGAPTSGPDLPSVIVFMVGSQIYGVDVNATEGVVECPRVAPLPNAPDGITGVTSVRGRITLVLDLSDSPNAGPKQRLILLRGEAQLGLLADRIETVVGLEPGRVSPTEGRRSAARDGQAHRWPATVLFKLNGKQVPIIDVEKLSNI